MNMSRLFQDGIHDGYTTMNLVACQTAQNLLKNWIPANCCRQTLYNWISWWKIFKYCCRVGRKSVVYGSLPNDSTNSNPSIQRIFYCIHGKANGCCILSDSELTDGPLHGSTAVRHKRRDSLTATIGKRHCSSNTHIPL